MSTTFVKAADIERDCGEVDLSVHEAFTDWVTMGRVGSGCMEKN